MTDVDLNFIARQVERVIGSQRSLHDDMHVLTAMVIRLEGRVERVEDSIREMSTELSAIHKSMLATGERLRKLEDAPQ
jgi:hypothetical protein